MILIIFTLEAVLAHAKLEFCEIDRLPITCFALAFMIWAWLNFDWCSCRIVMIYDIFIFPRPRATSSSCLLSGAASTILCATWGRLWHQLARLRSRNTIRNYHYYYYLPFGSAVRVGDVRGLRCAGYEPRGVRVKACPKRTNVHVCHWRLERDSVLSATYVVLAKRIAQNKRTAHAVIWCYFDFEIG